MWICLSRDLHTRKDGAEENDEGEKREMDENSAPGKLLP